MPWFKWSRVSNTNASADPTINWAEGQSPSTINDSARAMMSATAMYRDDIAGAIVTAGTSTAYTVSSFSQFDTLVNMNGQQIWFTPHVTNGATVTLNVDGLGAKPLRSAPNTELPAGVIIQGTPYGAIYNNTDGAWYLKGYFGSPYLIPLGCGVDYWGSTAPNSSFVFPIGQAISRTTYAALFALTGTTYGTGDGSTTFNLPDKRDRVSVMLGSGIRIANGYMPSVLGGVGGEQNVTLTTANLPPYTPNISVTASFPAFVGGNPPYVFTPGGSPVGYGGTATGATALNIANLNIPTTVTPTPQGGTSAAVETLQPGIFCNYIMRIL